MHLWRISEFLDLSGEGGRLFAGRWNEGGRPVVYTAETSALAMLELLVRYHRKRLPPPFQLIEIDAPEGTKITHYDGPAPTESRAPSQAWGEAWLATGATPLARVPSVVAPEGFNVLINPAHADAKRVRIVRGARHSWDARLRA